MAAIAQRADSLGALLEHEAPAVVFAYLFGSVATGTAGPRSDVDIAIYLRDPDDVTARLEAARLASIHLGTDRVDLVLLNTAPLSLAGRILQSRRVILDREPFLRHRYESLTARMFHDFRIREHRLLAERAARG
jgi:predicted nucleotidyltransferase